jgi:hypothetical protein
VFRGDRIERHAQVGKHAGKRHNRSRGRCSRRAYGSSADWIGIPFKPAVPEGGVIAFLHPCKEVDGWQDYAGGAGKFLLGAGKPECDAELRQA